MGEGFFLMAKLLFHVMDSSWRSISPSGQLEGLKQPLRHSWETSSVLRLVFTCGSPRFTFYLELVEVAAQDHSRNHIENKIALHFQSFITLCAALYCYKYSSSLFSLTYVCISGRKHMFFLMVRSWKLQFKFDEVFYSPR